MHTILQRGILARLASSGAPARRPSLGLGEPYPLVAVVEDGVVPPHEDVPQDPLGTRGDVHGHHPEQAGPGRLDHEVPPGHGERPAAEDELQVREGVHLVAGHGVLPEQVGAGTDGRGDRRDVAAGPGDEGGARVDDAVGGARGERPGPDVLHVDLPVLGLREGDPADVPGEFGLVWIGIGKGSVRSAGRRALVGLPRRDAP